MAEKIKDAEDRLLESLFESAPVADNGFSDLVVRRVRRRLWLRRLILPFAAILGGAIAFKPLTELVAALSSFAGLIPEDFVRTTISSIPQIQTIFLGAVLFAVCMIGVRFLEE